jgi:hypothetical protein
MPNCSRIGVPVLIVILASLPSSAQDFGTNANPPPAVELTIGHAMFVDDTTIHGTVFGGAMRLYLSPRVSIGPELTYVRDPGGERSLFLTGNVSIDLLRSRGGRPERVVPFVVAGGGFFRHTDPIGAQDFSYVEGALTGGGGARIWLGKRIYAAAEGRIGWEPHIRVTGTIGVELAK